MIIHIDPSPRIKVLYEQHTHRLADVDDPDATVEVKHVVLGEIRVDELAAMVHPVHQRDDLAVRTTEAAC